MLARSEADDRQPRIGITERRYGRVPPAGMLGPALLPERDQPRAQGAIARRLGLWDGREVGGVGHPFTRPLLVIPAQTGIPLGLNSRVPKKAGPPLSRGGRTE